MDDLVRRDGDAVDDRRVAERYHYRIRARYHLPEETIDESRGASVRNLSATGAQLILDGPLEKGTTIRLALLSSANRVIAETLGNVMWVVPEGSRVFRVGIHFATPLSATQIEDAR